MTLAPSVTVTAMVTVPPTVTSASKAALSITGLTCTKSPPSTSDTTASIAADTFPELAIVDSTAPSMMTVPALTTSPPETVASLGTDSSEPAGTDSSTSSKVRAPLTDTFPVMPMVPAPVVEPPMAEGATVNPPVPAVTDSSTLLPSPIWIVPSRVFPSGTVMEPDATLTMTLESMVPDSLQSPSTVMDPSASDV